MNLKKCEKCGNYTFKKKCEKCLENTENAHYKFLKFAKIIKP
ncbi:hypothetical protein J4411_00535 [Candidatus Pacearchaeota archaeon]|nr:hypothetical protein [Candidatus Pacearchaeota archaeon]